MERRQFLQGSSLGVAAAATAAFSSLLSAPADAAGAPAPSPASAAPGAHQRPRAEVRGKVAFITGGSSGIGLGMAQAFSEAGMKVIFSYLNEAHRDEALTHFKPDNAGVHALKLDVTDRDAMQRAADEAERVFGKVHLLCNNAGIGLRTQAKDASYKDWDWGLGVNLGGVVNGLVTFLPRMRAHGEGAHVLTTGSSASLVAGNVGVYVASKFAVMGLMESLRDELDGQNIGVSIFCPGLVKSNIAASERNRPAELRVEGAPTPNAETAAQMAEFMRRFAAVGMEPLEAGRLVLAGVRHNDLYILSHGEFRGVMRERAEALMASLPTAPPPPARAALTRTYTTTIYARERDWRLRERAAARKT
jgi:NAD(P)-dependent dehydrogenase (short-subunit alcohol dehydrogenase family)